MEGLCPIHHGQAICFRCRQCDVGICPYCKLTSHEGHVTVDLARVAPPAKEEVTSLVTTAQQQVCVSCGGIHGDDNSSGGCECASLLRVKTKLSSLLSCKIL